MEKLDNMQQNKVADEELDQITGGRKFFDIFTTEFWGSLKESTTLEMRPDDDDDFKITTLEMRDNPMKKRKDTMKVTKL